MSDIVTKAIQSRGWTVAAACKLWGIEYANFRRKCRRVLSGKAKNENEKAQLLCMCHGLEDKLAWDKVVAAGKLMDSASICTHERQAYLPKEIDNE